MPTILTNGIQLPDKGSVDWYSSMQSNYNLIDTHLGDTDVHVTAEDKANWNSKQGSLSQAQLDAIAQVATNTSDIATLQSGKANASHTHSSSDITDIGDYATKQYVDNSISGLVDSAPNALDTLNELAAALNDDANFASTVTTALSAKANSADLATVATSGSYDDLSNKPTINDSTITIQKNGSTVDTFTTNGSAKTIDIPVPTKTSDLTNDSNFVDTSNSAVASGITSAKVTSYDSHVADTDIHVTTADKNKWNNGVTQSYVFRYSSTALVAPSTNSNTLLDNTDNLKVGDKVIDSSGVLFSITAIDTANSTFTIGTALVDLAQDSDVVHKSGNETISGVKTITDTNLEFKSTSAEYGVSAGDSSVIFKDKNNLQTFKIYSRVFSSGLDNNLVSFFLTQKVDNTYYVSNGIQLFANTGNKNAILRPILANNNADGLSISLGDSNRRWQSVYATNYYYGNDNVEFSTKFVTSDTAQTITEIKTFANTIKSQKEIELTGNRLAYILPNFSASYSGLSLCTYGANGAVKIGSWKVDDNDNTKHVLNDSLGYLNVSTGSSNSVNIVYLTPRNASKAKLGDSVSKWHEINGVEPSSLSLPSGNINSFVDISGYFTNTGTGEFNAYPVTANGWVFLRLSTISGCQTEIYDSSNNKLYAMSTSGSLEQIMIPVVSGVTLKTQWATGSAVTVNIARFIPCQGNV